MKKNEFTKKLLKMKTPELGGFFKKIAHDIKQTTNIPHPPLDEWETKVIRLQGKRYRVRTFKEEVTELKKINKRMITIREQIDKLMEEERKLYKLLRYKEQESWLKFPK